MRTFAFFLAVFSDFELATERIKTIRTHYPDVEIICCDEWGVDAGFNSFCLDLNVFYFAGSQIKDLQFGGAWCLRMLCSFLSYSQADLMIRVEPDTQILRQFSFFPDADFFGNLRGNEGKQYIQGGCFGLTRHACRVLVDSDILSSPLYRTPAFGYFRYQPPYVQPGEQQSVKQLAATDLILWDAVNKLDLSIADWSEVCCYTFRPELDTALQGLSLHQISSRYAALHPCKKD